MVEIYFACLHIKLHPMKVEAKTRGGRIQWTLTHSTFMYIFLVNLVADDAKISTGLKKIHLNIYVKALNDHFKLNRSSDQIANQTLRKNTLESTNLELDCCPME
jgi:hypothetical protein